jgi:tetratricopeptide (TPR) repeat protein
LPAWRQTRARSPPCPAARLCRRPTFPRSRPRLRAYPDPGLSATALAPGQAFGTRYRIIRELGRGGMGIVYQAWDDELGVAVALKTIQPDTTGDPEAARERELRFKRELVLARQVTHKHVVRIHDLGEINGVKYLTMPFIQGETLGARIRREGHLPVARALHFAKQIVSGLAAAHDEGVVHRDLKPANVMIDSEGEIVILDFGLARSVSGMTVGTATGTLMGTVEYMAPEQASGSRVDQRADIYAFGLIFHEMLVGRRRSSDTALGELMLRTREAPPSVRSLDPQIPEAIDRIVARCLRPDPAERYQTSAELAADLDRLDAEGCALVEAQPAAPRRARWPVPALAVICLAAVSAAVWLFLSGRRPPPAPVAHAPVSVLIADFENQAGEKVFEGGLEQALGIGIEGASFITSYPRTEAAKVLERIKPGETFTEANARLVAQREGINVVLPGVIERKDAQYRIGLKVLDPSGQMPAQAVEATARSKSDVLTAVVLLSGKVRAMLGDTASASAMQAAAETFTTVSLDAMREYAIGQDLLLGRKDAEAIDHFRAAVEHDRKFGRAYAGWAVAAHTIGRKDEAIEQWTKAMQFIDRMTEREKYRTLGAYSLVVSRDYRKAIESFEELVTRYPADTAGHNNLAYAYFQTLDFAKASEEGRQALKLWPRSARFLSNSSLYAMYAGDFAKATELSNELIKLDGNSYIAYLPLAVAQAMTGDFAKARETYARMEATDESGRSTAALGLADLALYEGRASEARAILTKGLVEDERTKNTAGVISKQAALGDAALLEGDRRAAHAAADALVRLGRTEETLVPAAAICLAMGREAEARQLASELGNRVPPRSRAYGRIIEAQIALRQGRRVEAIDALVDAQKLADLWLVRYWLGIADIENQKYAEAGDEFGKCERRRGEAAAIFLDDLPTIRYLAPLSYWLGRASQGVGNAAAAAEQYKTLLARRPADSKDPLALDARARLAR